MADITGEMRSPGSLGPGRSGPLSGQAAWIPAGFQRVVALVAAATSHELRNRLQGVVGFLDLLVRSEEDGTRRQDLQFVLDSTLQLRDFAKKFGDLTERYPVRAEPLDLESVIRSSAAFCFESHPDADVRVLWRFDPAVATVNADPVLFPVALAGLMENAFEASGAGGRIHVNAQRGEGGGFVLGISDAGAGMPPEIREQTGKPFVSDKPGVSRGVGLWLVRRAVKLMGGNLRVGPGGTGRGTVAGVELPGEVNPNAGGSG